MAFIFKPCESSIVAALLTIGQRSIFPPELLHCVGDTLRVNNRFFKGVNDVRTELRDGLCWALKAEPTNGKVPFGVSFLDIRGPFLQHQHNYHYEAKHDLEQKVKQTRHMTCDFKAEAQPVDISDPTWPTDVRMGNIVVALSILSETCKESNTALMAWAYSHDIGCTDMAYHELLADTGTLPSLTAVAMEQRPQPGTARETDMCNYIKTDLGRTFRYIPTLHGEEVPGDQW